MEHKGIIKEYRAILNEKKLGKGTTGDWGLLIKVKAENVEAIGKFVIDKLRLVKGIEKTLTCVVFETEKETTEIPL